MFAALIEKLQRRQDLSREEAAGAMEEIMEGRAQPAQIAGLLIGLSMKGVERLMAPAPRLRAGGARSDSRDRW